MRCFNKKTAYKETAYGNHPVSNKADAVGPVRMAAGAPTEIPVMVTLVKVTNNTKGVPVKQKGDVKNRCFSRPLCHGCRAAKRRRAFRRTAWEADHFLYAR